MSSSLSEIARISEPNARIWLGEIPRVEETTSVPRHESLPEMLWWLLRKRGIRSFLGMCRRLLTGAQRGPVLVNKHAAVFFAPPEAFIKMAADAGLRIEHHVPHRTLDQSQQPCARPDTTISSVGHRIWGCMRSFLKARLIAVGTPVTSCPCTDPAPV